ncbi:DNA cytosine methyltransferase [Corynebacterium glutamicum]|uniref:DNA cytosine methyltransferase n=1 Tax=Corynebacterium glutamicum TaxID=1718 RepID=UPI003B5A1E5B
MPQSTNIIRPSSYTALEFFAGIGLARAGMTEAGIQTIWANDYDPSKKAMYANQWGAEEYLLSDIHKVSGESIPTADIAWSSSPCTDLSLAGNRVGLRGGPESSAFFGFTRALQEMKDRKPNVVVLENVVGLASSNKGADLRAAALEFNKLGYAVDCIILDTLRFLPQSRPRLFMVGALHPLDGGTIESILRPKKVSWIHDDLSINSFLAPFDEPPHLLPGGLTDSIIENIAASDHRWWSTDRVNSFVNSMSETQRRRLETYVQQPTTTARTAYRRTRDGIPVWEMRAEDIAGCLRTARGGSSKQAVVVMGYQELKIRWMTGTEYARLMGAGWFNLSGFRESQIQYGFGDAVSVPTVNWVTNNLILPNLSSSRPVEYAKLPAN